MHTLNKNNDNSNTSIIYLIIIFQYGYAMYEDYLQTQDELENLLLAGSQSTMSSVTGVSSNLSSTDFDNNSTQVKPCSFVTYNLSDGDLASFNYTVTKFFPLHMFFRTSFARIIYIYSEIKEGGFFRLLKISFEVSK